MRLLAGILFMAFLTAICKSVSESEILNTFESSNIKATPKNISRHDAVYLTKLITKDIKALEKIFKIEPPQIIDEILPVNESSNYQAKNLINNITQTLDYNIFIKQNLKNKFLEPHKMSDLQNATLAFMFSLYIGNLNDSQFIDKVYWLTEIETKRMFHFLTSGFNFSEEAFKRIFNTYIRFKRNDSFNVDISYYVKNKYKISILVDSMHTFYVTEGDTICTSQVGGSTATTKIKNPISLYTLFNNRIISNENGELNDNINLINSSENNYDQPLNLQASIEDNLDHLKIILNIMGQARNGENALHWASKKGFLDIVQEILSTGSIGVDSRNTVRWTPLQLASKEGHLPIVRELLNYNASVNSQDRNGDSPLHWASWEGHVSVVDELLKRDADVNIQNNYGNTPLSWAAWGGKLEVVRLLLNNNAKIDLKNYYEGWTSLHRAAEKGQLFVIVEFLSTDPSLVNIKDNRYRTAYDVAKEYGHDDVADNIKSFTNKNKMTENDTSTEGSTPIIQIKDIDNKTEIKVLPNRYKTELERTAEEGNIYAVKYILNHFGVSFFQDENGTSPLHLASKSGHVRVVRELQAHKSAVNAKDNDGWTPLHFAAKVGNIQIVKLLLHRNASVNVQTNNGDTPLHWAAWEGHLPVVKELLDNNAFINAENKWGTTTLSWASWKGDLDVVKYLLDNNAKVHFGTYNEGWSSMHRAVLHGHKQVAIEFVSRDPCVLFLKDYSGNFPYMLAAQSGHRGLSDYLRSKMNKKIYDCKNYTYSRNDLSGNAPIHWAALEGNLDSIKMILTQYKSYASTKKINGDTPLHLASKEGHIEIIEELILFGAPVDIKNSQGRTPLHLAASNGKLLAVMELHEHNASVDAKDSNGDSPLHWAVWEGHLGVIEELIERNASVNTLNSYGNTPVSWAAWAGRVDVIELLLKNGADIEIKNFDEGFNALHRAAEQGQLAAAKALLAYNPSLISIKDNRSRTPYDIAKQYKHEELAEYLKSLTEKVDETTIIP